jgi:hypothetical protein
VSDVATESGIEPTAIDLGDGRAIHGFVEEGYGPVADAFRRNLVERHDLGAACAVYAAGRPVVDLWGGVADRRTNRPWEVVSGHGLGEGER